MAVFPSVAASHVSAVSSTAEASCAPNAPQTQSSARLADLHIKSCSDRAWPFLVRSPLQRPEKGGRGAAPATPSVPGRGAPGLRQERGHREEHPAGCHGPRGAFRRAGGSRRMPQGSHVSALRCTRRHCVIVLVVVAAAVVMDIIVGRRTVPTKIMSSGT